MRVAVIGTGIAGNAAAWALSKRYPVTVYDRELRPGTFNPLSVYFCYRADGELALMIYEVRNTFGDIHAYVLAVKPGEFAKPACGNSRTSCFTFRPSSICRCAIISGSRRRRPTSSSESWRPTARAPARRDLPWPPPRLERGAAATVVLCAAAGHAENRGGDWEALRLWIKGVRLVPRSIPATGHTALNTASNTVLASAKSPDYTAPESYARGGALWSGDGGC